MSCCSRRWVGANGRCASIRPSGCFRSPLAAPSCRRTLPCCPDRERARAEAGLKRMPDDRSHRRDRGHQAASPAQMPLVAWKDIAKRTYKRTWDDNVALVSAGVAFYGFVALLSLLGLIVLVYGIVADPRTVIDQMRTLTSILPADVVALIGNQLLTAVHSSQETKGFGILLAALVAIYGGTNGAASVITALNIAYEEKEKRSLVGFYLLAAFMTLIALVTALAAIAGTAAVAYLQRFMPQTSGLPLTAMKVLGYVLLVILAAAVAATLYRFGPSREAAKWTCMTPGSVF